MAGRTPVGGRTLLLALLALALLQWASTPLLAQEEGCTLASGFWKNHPGLWPVTELTLDGFTYTQAELIELLETPPQGDASLILAHALIAAMLNVAFGAEVPADVAAALDAAQAWLIANRDTDGRLPFGITGGPERAEAIAISEVLNAYNEGSLGPGPCHDSE
jgi:hypothetical protein